MNVLLLANIGTWTNNYYHVGDEAMFITTLQWYKKKFKKFKITCFTSQPNHQNFKIKEIIHPFPVSYFNLKTFIKFTLKIFFVKFLKLDFLNINEKKIIEVIRDQDIVHLSGGGHLNSIYYDWLYYSLTIIIISRIYKKKIFITSHSLGPFNFKDLIICSLTLNNVDKIILREPVNLLTKIKYLIFFTDIKGELDSAYFLKKTKIKIKPKIKLRIGISLHDIKNIHQINLIRNSLKKLSLVYKIEILLIPHILVLKELEHDEFYMNSIFKKIDTIKVSNYEILKTKGEIAEKINYLTSTCDLLISSRYHGAIFSLSNSIPCLCVYNSKYYKQKFFGALSFIYPHKNIYRYLIDDSNKKFYSNLKKIINNIDFEKLYLTKINRKIKNISHFPCTLLLNEHNNI